MATLFKISMLLIPVTILTGCNIHPLPEDISRFDTTFEIVKKVRCETRDAIRNIAVSRLLESKSEEYVELGKQLNEGKITFLKAYRDNRFSHSIITLFNKYEEAAIAYSFTFDINEKNDNNFSLSFLNPFSGGKRTLGLGGGMNLQRRNERKFHIADEFADLATKQETDDYCKGGRPGENLGYPIIGTIGLSEAILTFVRLNEEGNLSSKEEKIASKLSDTIEFTTTAKGSLTPKIEISPLGSGYRLSEASLTNENSRTDKHSVEFSLSLPPTPKEVRQLQMQRSLRTGTRIDPTFNPTAKDLAIEELNRQQQLRLNRTLERLTEE